MTAVSSAGARYHPLGGEPMQWSSAPGEVVSMGEAGFALPAGVVTFLLTDVEGSTRLWEADPTGAGDAMLRLGALIDRAISAHAGVRPLEQGEGDSAVVAFSRASDAVAAAADLQLAIQREPWGDLPRPQVRIAIHTGEAVRRAGGAYAGIALNRCARLRALAAGGQTVLSAASADLVADHLPQGITLVDLGVHRLRDLSRPEHVHQLAHPELPAEFPPLRSLESVPNNLPSQLSSFIGRERAIAELRDVLAGDRLVTLAGSGGCGKTRLALQVAADVLDDFPDGVWFVDLVPVTESDGVASALMHAVGLKEDAERPPLDTAVAHLEDMRSLIVLDNCEHVIADSAAVTEQLLRACPGVSVIATSREVLSLDGERVWRVPSLTLPAEDRAVPIDALGQYEAVRLFVDRAIRSRPNFAVTNDNAPAVAQICQRLDGIPLAIELAAARVRGLTPQQILEGLSDRFRTLAGGARTAVARQQTLTASVDWSYDLLTTPEQLLLSRLSVFVGDFDIDAAEAVCSDEALDRSEVLGLLFALADKSLLMVRDQGSLTRYRLLETIRQYGARRLPGADGQRGLRQRHRDHFLALAVAGDQGVCGAQQVSWLARLAVDHDNLRAALAWSRETDDATALGRMACALGLFWIMQGHIREATRWLSAAATESDRLDDVLAGRLLAMCSYAAMYAFDYLSVPTTVHEGLERSRRADDAWGIARGCNALGWTLMLAVSPSSAREWFEEGLAQAQVAGDEWCQVDAMQGLGTMHMFAGDTAAAREVLLESREVARRFGNTWSERQAASWLGQCAVYQGRIDEALVILEQNAADHRDAHDLFMLSMTLCFLGEAQTAAGKPEAARASLEESIATAERCGVRFMIGYAQWSLSELALREGRVDEASDHIQAALAETAVVPLADALAHCQLAAIALHRGDLLPADKAVDKALVLAATAESTWARGRALLRRCGIQLARNEVRVAEETAHEALGAQQRSGDIRGLVDTLGLLATIADRCGDAHRSARLLGAAEALRESSGNIRLPLAAEAHEAFCRRMAAALGDAAWNAALQEGRSMNASDAVAYATRGRGARRRPASGWDSLTPAELDVVRFAAAGLTNPQIAARLFVSPRTIQTHLASVYGKLGLSTRTEVAAEAVRRGVEPAAV